MAKTHDERLRAAEDRADRKERDWAAAANERDALRAQVEWLRIAGAREKSMREISERALDDERAKVARVEALCDLEDERTDRANERLERAGVVEPKSSKPFRTVGIVTTRKIRAALAGDA